MCHKLFQVYACGHQKPVCTTPCPHAIATGQHIPRDDNGQEAELSRSVAIVSSTTPPAPTSTARGSNAKDPSSQRQSQIHPAPLLVGTPSTHEQRQSGIPPAFHFVASGQEPLPPPPRYSSNFSMVPSGQSSSQNPSPTWSTAETLVNTPSTPFAPAALEVNDDNIEPNFCNYYFSRLLPRCVAPCWRCYLKPEWEVLRKSWMKVYRELHPGVKEDDLEELTGIAGVRERFGG